MSTLPASFSYAFRGNYPTGRAAIFFQQLHKLPSTAALTMIVGPARFSRSMALELGCSTRIKAPQGMNLGEPKNMKQLAPAAAL